MSSNNIVIRVKNLSKCYEIYNAPRDRLKQFLLPRLQALIGRLVKQYFREFWAIKDLSFEIKKGQTVGIIGRNGAGKSTLLQIICGTLAPTSGSIEIIGRVAALLELGAGFNGEFTGRENIQMYAGVLGLSSEEIAARFDDITDFADIGDFLDQPVKTYSSGMYVRLAFAVVIHVDADVLIVDEALAVGDIAFQAKCMMALKRLMDDGATVLFVSHDTSSVRNLCQKVLWLDAGKSKAFGDPEQIIGNYVAEAHLTINSHLAKVRPTTNERVVTETAKLEDPLLSMEPHISFVKGWRRYGDGRAHIRNVLFLNEQGKPFETLQLHEKFVIRFSVFSESYIERPVFGFSFRDLKGNQVISSMTTNYRNCHVPSLPAGQAFIVEVSGENVLAQGTYTLTLGMENMVERNLAHEYIDVIENAITFQSSFGSDTHDIFPGLVWKQMEIQIKKAGVFSASTDHIALA
ncbi:lipopolysaccharide transport system ATP-binding protein [Rhodoferax ferrireducens]|uniref:Lipopolysaccharide transport system ATP-binding protein n=1 Tax=Rhodoferax ferrireducens TaxID=192843 RepID=A0ABU2C4N6_9BURK|nr:ABC transporter ATP-binding protein [Rhodoferax ferrireducens]MDR7376297.1 lipopolysaccharide transport system ATP-binding protein [Rhodoferax ferrireducens]